MRVAWPGFSFRRAPRRSIFERRFLRPTVISQTEKLLRELIALPSVNPAFLPQGHGRAGELRVSEFLSSVAASAGLDVELRRALPSRPNLLVRLLPARPRKRRVLLAPHLDTVNGSDEQFIPRKERDRLHGRGACDTKGSVASMLSALCAVARRGRRPAETEIVFAGLIDEENAQAGSRALVADGFKADLAIVGEATRLQVVTAHKGGLWLRMGTQGVAAHGAQPELGKNAVHEMARIVDLLETKYASGLRKRRHKLLGHPTVSVGAICGGTQANIVPDHCTILVDRRTVPGETEKSVNGEIEDLLASRKLKASIELARPEPCGPLETDPKLPLVAQFLESAGQRKPVGVNYFCDASVLAGGGIPSVVFGPGDIAQAHTGDEWIESASLDQATAMLERFLRTLT
jgi:acetylornithine deacetylase/succinyl-diaminopimelate desuccinylase-like protein